MTYEVTRRQSEIYAALGRLISRGETPTFKNIAAEDGCSLTYAYTAILSLENKGLVCRVPGKHGAIELNECSG